MILLKIILCFFISLNAFAKPKSKEIKWETTLSGPISDKAKWISALDYLEKEGHYFGLLVGSYRTVLLFQDVELRKKAYSNIIKVIDHGFPLSLIDLFIVGDLELSDMEYFSQSYNFYKAIVTRNQKMDKWSESFFNLIKKDSLKKYLLFEALSLYQKGEKIPAIEKLKLLLSQDYGREDFNFSKKVARTLAQIYYEDKNFKEAKRIYDEFLMKVNPITPRDWVDLAWNYYFLEDYSKALGVLHNLRSVRGNFIDFEEYVIRALVYKSNCLESNIEQLITAFDSDFGDAISQVINGGDIYSNPQIKYVASQIDPRYRYYSVIRDGLIKEQELLKAKGDFEEAKIINYVYESELSKLNNLLDYSQELSIDRAAEKIINISEAMKFLKFGTVRQKFNPKYVFRPREDKVKEVIVDDRKIIKWRQDGMFWMDERMNYQVELYQQCNN